MLMMPDEYFIRKGLEDAENGSYELFMEMVYLGPALPTATSHRLFEVYLMGYIVGLGYKGLL